MWSWPVVWICCYFNPRTPCGVRRRVNPETDNNGGISIHAPRAGCDHRQTRCACTANVFQSTHPVRGATLYICAPKVLTGDFNPRTPCGVRPVNIRVLILYCVLFQSTHPVRGATFYRHERVYFSGYFNPRTPCGVRLGGKIWQIISLLFQSTHPVRGATSTVVLRCVVRDDFNPRTPCGVRRQIPSQTSHGLCNFNPRTPCGVRRLDRDSS